MKKMKRNLMVVTVTVMVAVALTFTGQSFGFCVHNKSDKVMSVEQVSGGKTLSDFSAILQPGLNSCCHWSNTDCNKSGGKTASVGFTVSHGSADFTRYVCKDAKIPACSDLDITGSNGSYKCVTHGTETCN